MSDDPLLLWEKNKVGIKIQNEPGISGIAANMQSYSHISLYIPTRPHSMWTDSSFHQAGEKKDLKVGRKTISK
jgi:hypothetical protein